MSNPNRRPPSTDVFHFSLLAALLLLGYFINWSFGFPSGTLEFGVVISIAVIIWAIVAITDYFKR